MVIGKEKPQRHLSHQGLLILGAAAVEYERLYRESGQAAGLPHSTPHQMRHGGASADAITSSTDLTLTERGGWASTKSVRRYRQPAKYLRRLELLSPAQRQLAPLLPEAIKESIRRQLQYDFA